MFKFRLGKIAVTLWRANKSENEMKIYRKTDFWRKNLKKSTGKTTKRNENSGRPSR